MIRTSLHLIAYAGLALVFGYAPAGSSYPGWQLLGLVFVVALGMGFGMEALQTTLAHRGVGRGMHWPPRPGLLWLSCFGGCVVAGPAVSGQ